MSRSRFADEIQAVRVDGAGLASAKAKLASGWLSEQREK